MTERFEFISSDGLAIACVKSGNPAQCPRITTHDFYSGGGHEMWHDVNCRDVITNLLVWLSGVVKRLGEKKSRFCEMS
jgi:hypothetical protein